MTAPAQGAEPPTLPGFPPTVPPGPIPGVGGSQPAIARPRRSRRRYGCLFLLVLLVVIVVVPAALIARVPQQFGIWQSHPEAIFNQTPDPIIGGQMTQDLMTAGVPTQGLVLYVFNNPDGDGRIVYALLNSSDDFQFVDSGSRDPVLNLMAELASTPTATQDDVIQVAIDFRDINDNSVMVATASVQDATAYAGGQLDENDFLQRVDGWVDPATLLQAQLGGDQ